MTSTGGAAAAWYPDPAGRHEHRYWDGERWTVHVADQGVTAIDGGAQQPAVQQSAWQPVVEQPRPATTPGQTTTPGWAAGTGAPTPASPASTPASTTAAGRSTARGWIVAIAFVVAIGGIGLTAFLALGRNQATGTSAGGQRYPAMVETTFMNSCTASGGTTSYCRCALDHLEQDYDLGDLAGMEQSYTSTGKLPDSVMDVVRDCLPQLQQ
jgi:hypothetical protein